MSQILSFESISHILSEINPNITIDLFATKFLQTLLTPLSQEITQLPNDKSAIQNYIQQRFSSSYSKALISHFVRRTLQKPNNPIYQKEAIIDYILADILDRASSSDRISEEIIKEIIKNNENFKILIHEEI